MRRKKACGAWLDSARSELAAAEHYGGNAGLYKIRGVLIELETLEQTLAGRRYKIAKAAQSPLKADRLGHGDANAELALACAPLGDEVECGKHLQVFSKDGVDRSEYLDQSEFDIMCDKNWLVQLQGG